MTSSGNSESPSWPEVRELLAPPDMMDERWAQAEIPNDFVAIWCAPESACRVKTIGKPYSIQADGSRLVRSVEAQTELEDDVFAFLEEGGLPRPPTGYQWFLHAPSSLRSARDLDRFINRSIGELLPPNDVGPNRVVPLLQNILPPLYREA